jgi:hypothetical protein
MLSNACLETADLGLGNGAVAVWSNCFKWTRILPAWEAAVTMCLWSLGSLASQSSLFRISNSSEIQSLTQTISCYYYSSTQPFSEPTQR